MTFGVTLSDADGVPVACKAVLDERATDEAERLAHEAANLASIQHPGVVQLVSWDGATLVTEFAGQPLRQIVTVPTALAAGLVATLAHTVADLHDAGLVHGAVDVSHVLVGHGSHPRLCSLGHLALASSEREAADVAGLGCILRHLVGDIGDGDPIPDHRGPFRRGGRAQHYERRGLLTVADQATADVPGHRPTARRLAQMIADSVPGSQVTGPSRCRIGVPTHLRPAVDADPTPRAADDLPFPHPALRDLVVPDTPADLFSSPPPAGAASGVDLVGPHPLVDETAPEAPALPDPEPQWPADDLEAPPLPIASSPPPASPVDFRRFVAVAAAIFGVALLGAGALGFARQGDEQQPAIAAAADPSGEPATSTTSTTPATTTTAPTTTTTRCGTAGAPDLDGDHCGDELHVEGSIIRVGDIRFEAGRPGDLVTVGDWDCDGVVTPAVLRPDTGDVFVFAEWTDTEVAVRPLERVPSATRLYPDSDAHGCHHLVVEDATGRRTAIAVTR